MNGSLSNMQSSFTSRTGSSPEVPGVHSPISFCGRRMLMTELWHPADSIQSSIVTVGPAFDN